MSPEGHAATQGRTCSHCGGDLVDGSMGIPLLGSPRFAVKLGATEVTTEVLASMCRDCGRVELRARDPERIGVAAAAAANARRPRRVPWPRRPQSENPETEA